jgi:hypothetical protein
MEKPAPSFVVEKLRTQKIETDLTTEEITIIDEGIQEFREHPQNFISLKDYLAGNA